MDGSKNCEQMYKIYINQRPLNLCTPLEMAQQGTPTEDHLVARYPGKPKFLLNYIDLLEKASPKVREVTLFDADLDTLWADFQGHYKIVPAAGGLVRNFAKQWLLIFRRGYWDLPKGKIDAGESREAAAMREVREETGLQRLELGPALPTTYHTYTDDRGRRILKPTYWFVMDTQETTLIPQVEEDIEEAVWMTPHHFFAQQRPVYPNIADLLRTAQAQFEED
ncbi:MAG: NUDIX domain-containing protein [Bacteroidetes bacterium]|nr:MAG: NUDIX domain-containing protein [Bacteroidota bacterium]